MRARYSHRTARSFSTTVEREALAEREAIRGNLFARLEPRAPPKSKRLARAVRYPARLGWREPERFLVRVCQGNQFFFQTVGSTDKTLKLYEGHYHDLLNDIGKEDVMADITGWIDAHVR